MIRIQNLNVKKEVAMEKSFVQITVLTQVKFILSFDLVSNKFREESNGKDSW